MALARHYDCVEKYIVHAELSEPMHVGSALGKNNDILVHPVDGVPFIQSSGIAGVFRSYTIDLYGQKIADYLFGESASEDANHESKIKFSDGIFDSNGGKVKIELRPRVAINDETGTVMESKISGEFVNAGHKFEMESIGAGEKFSFVIYVKTDSRDKGAVDSKALLEDVFAAANNNALQLGGQKTNGCGYICIKEVLYKKFDLTDKKERELWLQEDSLADDKYDSITEFKGKVIKPVYRIVVSGKTEGAILVKAIAVTESGKDAPRSVNIQNAKRDYIVPASSFKGAVRSQMERVSRILADRQIDTNDIIWNTFGGMRKNRDNEDEQMTGNIRFYDTVIGNREENDTALLTHRIRIDKFTGGVINGGLFSERRAAGNVEFKIDVLDKNEPKRTAAILIYALRDLADGLYNIGGGYSVGNGIIDVETINIKAQDKEAILNFKEGTIVGDKGILSECMKALTGEGES